MSFAVWDFIFQPFLFQIRSSGGFLPVRYKPPQGPHAGSTGRLCCFAGVAPLSGPQNRTQGRTGASLVFLPKTNSPLPLKGEGRSVAFLWFVGVFTQRNPVLFRRKDGYFVSEGFSRQLPVATAGHNWLTRLQQGRSGALLVSLPYLASKTAHRATQGRVWFSPAYRRFSGGPPSR